MNSETQLKLVILGKASVGKTSIINRYTKNEFEKTDVTIMAGFIRKKIFINENLIDFQIWDTAGQEKYRSLIPLYYKDANIAFLVYDVSDPDSFLQLKTWVKELKEKGPDNILLFIIGNKIDLEEKVPFFEVKQYAEEIKAILKFTSAKKDLGVEEVFNEILMMKMLENGHKNIAELNGGKGGSKIHDIPKENYQGYWFMNYCSLF